MKLLLGCDPEVFVREKGKKRYFTSAHGLNEGTKDVPVRVECGAVQVDGMALEFNIDPAATEDEWFHNITTVMNIMKTSLPDNLEIVATPVALFTKKHLAEQPLEAKELGCTPDYNAWKKGEANPRPNAEVNFRTGAGHIHFGWCENADVSDPLHLEACMILTQALDLTLAPLCALFDTGYKRRELYGAPGAFRPKPYGCEYRVVSNAWLRDEETIRWVYKVSHAVFNALCAGKVLNYSAYKPTLLDTLSRKTMTPAQRERVLWRTDMLGLPKLNKW